MIAIAEALKRWRETTARIRAITPLLSVTIDTDADAGAPNAAALKLSVRTDASETNAVVPYVLTEEIKTGDPARLDVVVRAVLSLNGKAHFDPDATIHRHSLTGIEYVMAPGLARTARLTWEGEASWRGVA